MPTVPKSEIPDTGGLPDEGWHLATVADCEEKRANRGQGDRYYNVRLEDAVTGQHLAYDVIMLEGKGVGIGIRKLHALGAAEDLGDSWHYEEAQGVVGCRAHVKLYHEEYQGKTRAKVALDGDYAGYLPESDPPEGDGESVPFGAPPEETEDDDLPF